MAVSQRLYLISSATAYCISPYASFYAGLSCLLAPLCATIPVMDELCRRSCNFINACLSSDSSLISFVARQGIFYSRMASPIGRNTHFCCMRYGERTQDISFILNNYINYRVTSNLPEDVLQTAGLLCQLCFLRDLLYVVMFIDQGH